jgi:threonine/homoserine/homoserine lactone efflux protein
MSFYIIQGIIYGFASGSQPGPFQTFLILQTLDRGWKKSLPMIFAPLLSDGPILTLVLLVLTRVPVWLVQLLEIAGGMFVIYLSLQAWKSWRSGHSLSDGVPVKSSRSRTILQAVLVNLLNPNPYLFWSLVTGPILVTGWRQAPVNGIALLTAFYLTMLLTCFVIILLFAMAHRLGSKTTRILQLLSTIALAAFGFYHVGAGLLAYFSV